MLFGGTDIQLKREWDGASETLRICRILQPVIEGTFFICRSNTASSAPQDPTKSQCHNHAQCNKLSDANGTLVPVITSFGLHWHSGKTYNVST